MNRTRLLLGAFYVVAVSVGIMAGNALFDAVSR